MKNDEPKETKPVSFRLSSEVFEALQAKGQSMQLSAHELAGKIVQEHYKTPIEAVVMNEAVTHSKTVVLPPPTKQVFHFTTNDLRSVNYTLTGSRRIPCHAVNFRIGIEEWRGLRKIGEDLWEIEVGNCHIQVNNGGEHGNTH